MITPRSALGTVVLMVGESGGGWSQEDLHLEWSGRAVPAPGATGGGDWYDVVARPDGTVALVLGDVMGHGDAVAATADCMRTTIRALTAEGHDAEAVMGAARRLANRLATTATLFYGLLDLGSGRLRGRADRR